MTTSAIPTLKTVAAPAETNVRLVSGTLDRKTYEESGVTVALIASFSGGTAAVFGVPSARNGGPANGQSVDMRIAQELDLDGGVASNRYAGAWRPTEVSLSFDGLKPAQVASSAPKAAYVKPENYARKAFSATADEATPATADASA